MLLMICWLQQECSRLQKRVQRDSGPMGLTVCSSANHYFCMPASQVTPGGMEEFIERFLSSRGALPVPLPDDPKDQAKEPADSLDEKGEYASLVVDGRL